MAFLPKIPSGKVYYFGHVWEKFGGKNKIFVLNLRMFVHNFGIFVLNFGISVLNFGIFILNFGISVHNFGMFALNPGGKCFAIFARIFTPGTSSMALAAQAGSRIYLMVAVNAVFHENSLRPKLRLLE